MKKSVSLCHSRRVRRCGSAQSSVTMFGVVDLNLSSTLSNDDSRLLRWAPTAWPAAASASAASKI